MFPVCVMCEGMKPREAGLRTGVIVLPAGGSLFSARMEFRRCAEVSAGGARTDDVFNTGAPSARAPIDDGPPRGCRSDGRGSCLVSECRAAA